MQEVQEAAKDTGVARACGAVDLSRSGFYRLKAAGTIKLQVPCAIPTSCVAQSASILQNSTDLTPTQQDATLAAITQAALTQQIVEVLNSERFLDCAPRQVWATLLDEGVYLCSWRTMYRLLHRNQAVKERRSVRRHPKYVRPELAASGPNQVWTWDITYVKGPIRGQFYYLYVVMDIFSRLVVGWLIAECESAEFAVRLLERSYRKHEVKPGQLTVHADRGAPMKSKSLGQLLSDLDVMKTHSRPRVSNDNPFSEAGFKTMKYSPDFPARFDSLAASEAFCRAYFTWYNTEHRHTGIALLTPTQLHYGEAAEVLERRQLVLSDAFALTPHRFRNGQPQVERPPTTVWINRPAQDVYPRDALRGG